MATNFLELATTLKYLGAKWLLGKKVNFIPWTPQKNQAPVFLTTPQIKENPCFLRQLIKINQYNYNCTSSETIIVIKEKIVLQHMHHFEHDSDCLVVKRAGPLE